jgi:hypothetical protein
VKQAADWIGRWLICYVRLVTIGWFLLSFLVGK